MFEIKDHRHMDTFEERINQNGSEVKLGQFTEARRFLKLLSVCESSLCGYLIHL